MKRNFLAVQFDGYVFCVSANGVDNQQQHADLFNRLERLVVIPRRDQTGLGQHIGH